MPLTTVTSPPKLFALFSVISLAAPAVRLVAPVMLKLPLSLIAPPAVSAKLPVVLTPVRSIAFSSVIKIPPVPAVALSEVTAVPRRVPKVPTLPPAVVAASASPFAISPFTNEASASRMLPLARNVRSPVKSAYWRV